MPGRGGNRFLSGRIKQAFTLESRFECLKSLLERTQAGGFEVFHDDLEIPAVLVQGHLAANPDLVSFPGQGADPLVGATEHGTPDLAFLIFEREIPVPGGWSGKAGEFPLNPDLHKA